MMNNYKKLEHIISQNKDLDVIFIKGFSNINYFTNYLPIVRSRAFGLFYGQQNLFIIPGTSYSDVKAKIKNIELMSYIEYPMENFNTNFEACISEFLKRNPSIKNIGIEGSELTFQETNFFLEKGISLIDLTNDIQNIRAIKGIAEIKKIKLAADFSNQMILNCINSIRHYATEKEIDEKSLEYTRQSILKDFPDAVVDFFSLTTIGASRTVLPHTISSTKKLEKGDMLIFCRQTSINGYRAQCDRMVFTAMPTKEEAYYYGIVLEAFKEVRHFIEPGISAKSVDLKIREVFKKYDVEQYFIHRSGSGIGLDMAEYPMLQFMSEATIKKGMVLIIQPALYISGVGGFRITDTLLVTDESNTLLTDYPRNLEDLVISI